MDHQNLIKERKAKEFQWKVMHRTLFTEQRLMKMRRSNGFCSLCKIANEDILHLLVECPIIKEVWNKIETCLSSIVNTDITLDMQQKILGTPATDDNDINYLISFVSTSVKWILWKHRNDVRYGHQKISNSTGLYNKILKNCEVEMKTIQHTKYVRKKLSKVVMSYMQDFLANI
jgi:hypothetical protein